MGSERNGNWGRWGDLDEYGSLNLIDAQKVLDGIGLIRTGRVLSLAQPIGPKAGVPGHRNKGARFMDRDAGDYALGARSPGGSVSPKTRFSCRRTVAPMWTRWLTCGRVRNSTTGTLPLPSARRMARKGWGRQVTAGS